MKNKIVIRSLIISLALLFVMGLLLAVIPIGKRAKSYADVAYNTVGFEKTSAGINNMGDVYYFGNWFKVKVIVKGNAGEVVSFRYYTESGTAIPGVDYVEQSKTVSVKIAANGQETYTFSVQCILKYNTRERVHVLADGEEYGRYFKIKIDSVENAVVEEGKDVCKCTLPYDSKVNATVGSVTEVYGGRREIAYFDDYADTLSVASSGEYDVEDKTSWKSWENGVVFDRQTLTRWYSTLIGSGLASAWGSFFFGKICDGSSDIYLSAGGADMMKAYSSPSSDTTGMSLQLVFDPDTETILLVHKHDIAYKLNGRGHYLISTDKNPNDDDKYYIDLKDKYVKSAYKRAYWIQDGTTWYANDGAVVDSVFYEIEKISDIDFGIAVYSNSDIFVKNVSLFMKLMDNKAPVIMGSYVDDSQFMNTGKLRLAIRFSEPVYTSKILASGERNTLELKINNKSTPCYAQYVEGNYTDTLIYEIDAADLPKTNITSIQYKFSDNDIGDMAYAMNQYKVIENNFLVNADSYREFSMNGSINFFQPDLTVDKGSSMQDKNFYNIMLSINADENAEGNVYYEWSTDNVKQDNLLESAYEFSYKLREEDSGSLGVTLVKNESAGVFSGTYYLHALAVSPYGLKDYKCFGPYKLDGDPPTISTNIPTNELKTKIFELNNSKEGGAEIINVDFVVEWKDGSGKTQTAKRTLLDNGERTTGLFRVLTDNQKYQYSSSIDDSLTEPPLDEFILEIMGDEMRLDANVSFEVKDSAGNVSETPAVRVVYDKRNVFKVDSDFPAEYGYVKIEDISTTYNAYDITAADRSDGKGISISVQADDRSQIVLGETAFSVRVNGDKTYTASDSDPYTVVIGDLGSGFYELIPSITGETGGAEVELVSNPICFYLTNGKNDDTANKLRTQEDMVFTNKVFQINDARYYYLDVAGSVVSSHLYGATYDSVMNRYNGGSLAPTFSTSTEAKKYVKYMEYQDLYLVQITANMASLLNSSSGSTTYMKAPGETATAQEGQLWIRYKRSSWTNNSNAYGWAYYYYGIGSLSAGINITYLSANLTNAINTVVNRIVAAGESINLVHRSVSSGFLCRYVQVYSFYPNIQLVY
ncbi:MAG: hypothetical protein SPL13_04230 [Clostridia bacterium]|nr:hypothetical protein [Clostridia bacterium]